MAGFHVLNALFTRQDLSQLDPSQIPLAQPPDGVTPNFVNPPSLAPVFRACIYVFMPIMSALVLVRLGTRLKQMHKLVADDIFCMLGAASIIAYCATVLVVADNPLGRNLWDVPLSMITEKYLRLTTVGLVLHTLGSMFFKLTLLTLILRLFGPILWARWLIWGGIAATTILYTSLSIYLLSNCVPGKGQTWHYTQYYGSCTITQQRSSVVNGVFGLISDLYILVIPLWLIFHLKLPSKRKLGVMGVFLTGILTCGCSAGGVVMRVTSDLADGEGSIVYVFGILELNIGLICACMPVVALPFKTIGASIATSWNSFRDYSRTRLLNRSNRKLEGIDEYNMTHSPSYRDKKYQLPQVVKGDGAITGLKTFMRRAYRSTVAPKTQKTAPLPDTQEITTANFTTADYSIDYHDQLKNIHSVETSRGSDYSVSHPMPQPPMPAALRQQGSWPQNQQTCQNWTPGHIQAVTPDPCCAKSQACEKYKLSARFDRQTTLQ